MAKDYNDIKSDLLAKEGNKLKNQIMDYRNEEYHHLMPYFREHDDCSAELQAQYLEYSKYTTFNTNIGCINNFPPIFNVSHPSSFYAERMIANQNEKCQGYDKRMMNKPICSPNSPSSPDSPNVPNLMIASPSSVKKPHNCQYCEKKFGTKQNLYIHCRIHTNEKPYSCDSCDKKFTTKQNLVLHIRTHTNEKPYKCDICENKFSTKQNLNVHARVHTQEKPFPCENCNKKFSTKQNLDTHLRTHTDDKPYSCHFCSKKFCTKQNRDTHLKTHMSEDSITQQFQNSILSPEDASMNGIDKWPDGQYDIKFSENTKFVSLCPSVTSEKPINNRCNKGTNT